MSNVATLAGHVTVEDRAVIGGLAAVHQFCKIGRSAMIGGQAHVNQDVPPFMIVSGQPAYVFGLNSVGLARAGIPQAELPHSVPQRAFFAGSNRNHGTGA